MIWYWFKCTKFLSYTIYMVLHDQNICLTQLWAEQGATENATWAHIWYDNKNSATKILGKSLSCEFRNARRNAYFEIQLKIIFHSSIRKKNYGTGQILCKKMWQTKCNKQILPKILKTRWPAPFSELLIFGILTSYNFRQEQPFAWNLVSYESTRWDLSNDV